MANQDYDPTQPDMDFFEKLYGSDPSNEHLLRHEPTLEPEPVPVPEQHNEVIIEGKQEVGSIIEYRGEKWLVTLCAKETEVEGNVNDEYDERLPLGWHSWLARMDDAQAMQVVVDQYKEGAAQFMGSTCVLFSDEQYSHRLRDLAYSPEIGLYDKTGSNANG